MTHNWKQWVGQVVNGQFPLLQDLGCSEDSAVFLTERHEGDGVSKAAIKLVPTTPDNSELQLSRWRLAAGLSHPNLIKIFDMGKCELDNVPLLYVVMECADENLAQVLSVRVLTPAETHALLEPVLEVLAYLHGRGLVHGHVKPANILADDDRLKLSSDGICRAGESGAGFGARDAFDPPESARGFIPTARNLSPAGDVWSLGATLVEALTQQRPLQQSAGHADTPVPQALPEPFLDIARHCLLQNPAIRWTVAEIAARLEGRSPVPVPQAPTAVRAAKPAARAQQAHSKRHWYGVAIAAGVVLAAIVAGPKLFRHNSGTTEVPAAALAEPAAQPAVQPAAKPQAPQEARAAAASTPNVAEERQDSRVATPAPAPVGLVTPDAPAAEEGVKPAADASVEQGEVLEQVLPDVPQSARATIQGKVRVVVRVDVDASGRVEGAQVETPGPSRYFNRLALEAAQRWRFQPPKVAGRNATSNWTLPFQFTSAEVTVLPAQQEIR
jgi:TonB family protein